MVSDRLSYRYTLMEIIMIILTKLDGTEFVLNCDLIETIQMTPDTVIRLVNDKVIIVKESLEEIINKTIAYRKHIYSLVLEEPSKKKKSKE